MAKNGHDGLDGSCRFSLLIRRRSIGCISLIFIDNITKNFTLNINQTDQRTTYLELGGDTMSLKSQDFPSQSTKPTYNFLAQLEGKTGIETVIFQI